MNTQSFVRAAEVWLPSEDGASLVFGSGFYGPMGEFAALSRTMSFRRGEGLPGEAWEARHPVVMRRFEGSSFRRIEAAAAAGLTSGIAMPIFSGDAVKAVVVLLCGDDEQHVGAIEVWRLDPEEDAQIGLHDGYYGGAELFERQSRMTRFGKGSGLPGGVWATDMPMVLRNIYASKRFLRRDEALEAGLTMGVGLPFNYDPGRVWVMVVLSALGTPIARRFEVWVPDESGAGLVYDAGLSEDDGAAGVGRPGLLDGDQPFLGAVLRSATPAVTEDCAADAPWLVADDERSRPHAAVAIPTLSAEGKVKAVTAWRF